MIKYAEAQLVGKVENNEDKAPDVKCNICSNKYPIYMSSCPYCSKLDKKS